MKRPPLSIALPRMLAATLLALAGAACAGAEPGRVRQAEAGLWDDPMAAERAAEAALAAGEAAQDPARRLAAALRLATAASWLEHDAVARRAAALARPLAPGDETVACLLAPIAPESDDERRTHTLAQLERALAQARARHADWCVARLQSARGQLHDRNGRSAEAAAALLEALGLFEAEDDTAWVASTRASLAWLYSRWRDNPQSLQRAIDHGEAAAAVADREGWRSFGGIAHHNLAGAHMAAGHMDDAYRHAARALELAQSIGDVVGTAYIARLQARVELERQHPEAALPLYARAQAVFAASGDAMMELVCRVGRLRALAALRRWGDLRREMEPTEALLAKVDDPDSRIEFHRVAMVMWEAQGDNARALASSKAWAAAQQDAVRAENRRAASEAQERFESARKEDENRHLREQQAGSQSRQRLLGLTLLLALALIGALLLHGRQQRRLRHRLRELAERDELTQLPNRRTILAYAQQCLRQSRAGREPVAVAVLDIDHFKNVNDRHGHEVGDAALRSFAAACARVLRPHDRIGRLGGEEFLGVFPGARPGDLPAIFERLRGALRETQVPGMAPDERLSFSMGGALAAGEDQIDSLVRRADGALYEAKSAGRDRLALAA